MPSTPYPVIIEELGKHPSGNGEAQKEANRDGVPPIELIDGERLVSLFEKYELGLKPKTVYELVPEFFRSFES